MKISYIWPRKQYLHTGKLKVYQHIGVVVLDKILCSHSAFLHPDVLVGISELNDECNTKYS